MKREIKFRAWHKNRKTFLDFDWAVDKLGRTFSILDKCVYDEFTDEIELMQYIGLDDVNGVEIYENDIVKSNYKYAQPKISQIIMEDGNSYIAGEDLATGNEMLVSDHVDEIEVIGNIHDNPELLKGGEMSNLETPVTPQPIATHWALAPEDCKRKEVTDDEV